MRRALAASAACAALLFACGKKNSEVHSEASSSAQAGGVATGPGVGQSAPTTTPVPSKPGMVWVPAGLLHAGTAPNVAPRIADEELPGTPVPLGGFYIDKYPFPNEPGAIPTTAVSRDDAQTLCASKGKRLCTELEWERACKGPDDFSYEYGMRYQKDACGTGVQAERASLRPNGERAMCKSGFGVMDLHGGVWQWTDSAWGRHSRDASLGVLRGGNAKAGELVGRCANALGRPVTTRNNTIGFRCCAGPRNDAAVTLDTEELPSFERRPDREVASLTAPLLEIATNLWGSRETEGSQYEFQRAWLWRPVRGEELVFALGCEKRGGPWAHCGVVVARVVDSKATLLAQFATGAHIPDLLARKEEREQVRARGMDIRGTFARDVTYAYGRVHVSDEARP
jgi:formylglycine-generating enzyme required for sulfatase activity